MEMIGTTSIIALIVMIMSVLKSAFKKYSNFINFIPLISALLGATLGLIAFYAIPTIVPTDNLFHAIIYGLLNGLSTSGSVSLISNIKDFVITKKALKENSNNLLPSESINAEEDIKQENSVPTTENDSTKIN